LDGWNGRTAVLFEAQRAAIQPFLARDTGGLAPKELPEHVTRLPVNE
jgi:hypothetical protein